MSALSPQQYADLEFDLDLSPEKESEKQLWCLLFEEKTYCEHCGMIMYGVSSLHRMVVWEDDDVHESNAVAQILFKAEKRRTLLAPYEKKYGPCISYREFVKQGRPFCN